jgi:diguanylate cyclase (GGDEF)-like protein/PAS domain S-box-containing protein
MSAPEKPTATTPKGTWAPFSRPQRGEPWEASPRGALKTTLVLLLAIAVSDGILDPQIPIGVLFVMPVLTSVWMRKRRMIFGTATLATLLVLFDLGSTLQATDAEGVAKMSALHGVAGACVTLFILWTTVFMGFMWLGARRELLRSERTTRQTLTNLAEGVVTVDQDGLVVLMNPAAERMTGWELSAARGQSVDEVVRRENDALMTPEQGVPPGEGEILISRSGDAAPVEVSEAELEIDSETGGYVLVLKDASERRSREGVMLQLAYRDRLTGLPNRASLNDRIELELAHARRSDLKLALLFLDLDGLKIINDNYGHAAGDALLVGFAERLRSVLREGDTVARLGGDEFTVLLPNLDDGSHAAIVAEKILIALETPILHEGQELDASISIGIALFPEHGPDGEQLLKRADEAMYKSKQAGGSQFRYWIEMEATPV